MKLRNILFVEILLVSLVLLIMNSLLAYGAGLGVAPATLRFENALKGAETEKQVSIQNPSEQKIVVSVSVSGELSSWVEFSPPGKTEVPAGGDAKVTVKLTPPKDMPDGEYLGYIHATVEKTEDLEGTGMGLFPGVDSTIIAEITDKEIIGGKVQRILTKDEEYGTPVRFTLGFTNTGNVPEGPDVRVEIIKRGTGIIDTIEKTMEDAKPGQSRDYEVLWDTNGREKNVYYRADVTVLLNDEVLEKKEDIGFRVLEKGGLDVEKEPSRIGTGMVIIAVILIAGIALYYVITKRKE
ncbi:hypothetical protein KY366_03110 [Candidatus Woesearchaeota archaeon]|nr:hypothetical protein [Candidatus Woesearchaeota archaeon]